MRWLILGWLGALGAFVLVGCGPNQYVVRVSGLARDGQATTIGTTYQLRSADPIAREDDLMFLEVARLVERGLSEMGYVRVSEGDRPDEVIYLGFGSSEPIVLERIEERPLPPTYSAHVHSGHGHGVGLGFTYNFGHDSTYRRRRTYTRFETILALDAVSSVPDEEVDPDGVDGDGAQVWSLRAFVRTPSPDVRFLVPYLIVASFESWGRDTGQEIVVAIEQGDPRVDLLRQGLEGWDEPLEEPADRRRD